MTWTRSSCTALVCLDLGMKLELGLRPVCCQAREGGLQQGCEAQGTPSCSLAWCPGSWRRASTGAVRAMPGSQRVQADPGDKGQEALPSSGVPRGL